METKELTNEEKIAALRQIPGLDVSAGLAVIANMEAPYLRILGLFVKNWGTNESKLDEEFCETQDELEGFRTLIHGYKSALGNLGALELAEKAFSLETSAKNNNRAAIEQPLSEFKSGVSQLVAAVERILS